MWLDSGNIIMYSTHYECKSVLTERFIKTLKAKVYKKWQLMMTERILFIWVYLSWHHYINKKSNKANYSALNEKIETNLLAPKFIVNDRVIIMKYKNIFSKAYTENWSREIFIIDSFLKTNPLT